MILSISDSGQQIYDSETDSVREDNGGNNLGTAYYVAESGLTTAAEQEGFRSWMGRIARRLRIIALQALAITLVFNLLSVATPLFVMSVYDSVIPSTSVQQLLFLLAGIVLAVWIRGGIPDYPVPFACLCGWADRSFGRHRDVSAGDVPARPAD